MSIITYSKSGRVYEKGLNWKCYDASKFNSTLIFYELKRVIRESLNCTYEELIVKLRESYEKTELKSRCNIYESNGIISICKPNKSMPDVWVTKNEEL